MNRGEFERCTQRVNEFIERVKALPDVDARTAALELLEAVMDLHGAAMSRIVELLSQSGEVGRASLSRLSTDPLVCGLLVLYGIHPVSLEERVSRSLDGLRGQLEKQGASAELVSVRDGAARVKLQVSGGPWSPEKLKASVQQAILEVAPELAEVILEGVPSPNFIPINMLQLERTEEKNYEESAT